MAWDNNFIDELKMQINIVDVVGREVQLKKSGANYKGLCPFHSEKTPSFMVNEEKQIFNCFGCGEKGDAIRFVQSYYKLPFMEAVEKLCGEYGIKMPEYSSRPKIDYDKYYEINAKAARFYYNCLGIPGNSGLAYFKKRGLQKETISRFGLGYAPDSWTALTDHLRKQGVSDQDMLKLGLAKQGKNGLYDKFRNRVVFPIINVQGKVIGFGARALDDSKPKYLNSDESDIFLKKNNLFGLNLSRKDISDEDKVIIVEGYMDLISLYQSGIHNVAASLGTALTDNQARLLCRYTKNAVLSYDSDNAGVNAALRGIDVITKAGGKVRILSIDDGKDPDDYVKAHGKEAFLKLVDKAVTGTDFELNNAKKGFDLTKDTDILEYVEHVVPVLRKLGPIEQDIYVKKLSKLYNISEYAINMSIRTEGENRTPSYSDVRRKERTSENTDRDTRVEMSLLVLAMNNVNYLRRIREDGLIFRSQLSEKILSVEESLAQDLTQGNHRIDEKLVFRELEPDEESVFAHYLRSIELGPDDEAFYIETRAGYQIDRLKEERAEILNDIAVAEKLERPDEMERLAGRLIEIDSLIKKAMEECNA